MNKEFVKGFWAMLLGVCLNFIMFVLLTMYVPFQYMMSKPMHWLTFISYMIYSILTAFEIIFVYKVYKKRRCIEKLAMVSFLNIIASLFLTLLSFPLGSLLILIASIFAYIELNPQL